MKSPDGRNVVQVEADGDVHYSLARDGQPILTRCRLTLTVDGDTWGAGAKCRSARRNTVGQKVDFPVARRARTMTDEHNELVLAYGKYTIEFRAYNDGEAMPGAAEVLAKVKAAGLQRIVVTGSGQRSLIDKLEHTYPGIFEREKMVTAFDVKYGKPHPEPYLIGLQKAGVEANEAIVVENAPLGVQAGVAAGIFTIGVNTGPLADRVLREAGADLLFPSMGVLAQNIEEIIMAS